MSDAVPDQGAVAPEPEPKPAKTPRTPRATLNIALIAYIAITAAYGLPMLLWPTFLYDTVGGASRNGLVGLVTTRWAGGVLIGLAIGALFVLARPRGQRTFVTMISIHTALAAAGIWISVANGEWGDAGIDSWFYLLSGVVVAALSAYLWFARFKAREVLAMP